MHIGKWLLEYEVLRKVKCPIFDIARFLVLEGHSLKIFGNCLEFCIEKKLA